MELRNTEEREEVVRVGYNSGMKTTTGKNNSIRIVIKRSCVASHHSLYMYNTRKPQG